jgi:hypothetical protein
MYEWPAAGGLGQRALICTDFPAETHPIGRWIVQKRCKAAAEAATEQAREDFFFCEARTENVSTMFCIDSFVDVNALNIKDSPCFKCAQGGTVRDEFSNR